MATLLVNPQTPLNMDRLGISTLPYGTVIQSTPGSIVDSMNHNSYTQFLGSFLYDGFGNLAGGTVATIVNVQNGTTVYALSGLATPAASVMGWALTGNEAAAKEHVFAGDDLVMGSIADDRLRGYGGNDTIVGGEGNDYLDGGAGIDVFDGGPGRDTVYRSATYAASRFASWKGVTMITDPVNGPDFMVGVENIGFTDQLVPVFWGNTFDPLAYLASHMDLVAQVGIDPDAAWRHYAMWGANAGWKTSFDPQAYMATNPDVLAATGGDRDAASVNYILWGAAAGRSTGTRAPSAMAPSDMGMFPGERFPGSSMTVGDYAGVAA